MADGGEVDVGDKEDQHQKCADDVTDGDPLQVEPTQAPVVPRTVEQVQQAGQPDQRVDHQLDEQVRQPLQRVVFGQRRLPERMWGVGEDPGKVITQHRLCLLHGGYVLFPLTGREVPEYCEDPQCDQHPGGGGVIIHRALETEPCVGTVDLKAGQHHEHDQSGLGPVPKTFESLKNVYALHRLALLFPANKYADRAVDKH